jgi:hypothetical protein
MRASPRWIGALVLVTSSVAWAQAPRSPQEEKRRKLLEGLGLQKDQNSPTPAPPPVPAPTPALPSRAPEAVLSPVERSKATVVPGAPSFRRAVHPMLMATCSACHRAGGPAGATRLTLSGDAVTDHAAALSVITVRDPGTSSLLAKVSGQPHAGGAPWPRDSGAYGRVLAWIAKGARLDAPSTEQAAAIVVSPPSSLAPARKRETPASAPAPVPAGAGVADAPPPPAVDASLPTIAAPEPKVFADAHQVLMSKCGGCHRAGAPAGTTKLLLTGDAAADEAVARALVEPSAPAESLLLTKATGTMHAGGVVLPEGDPPYELLLAWATPAAAADSMPRASTPTGAETAPPPPVAVVAERARSGHPRPRGVELPLGLLLNGRFDLNYERRAFNGQPFDSEGVNALRSYHHFLFLSRERADEPCGLSVEILALTFWEAHCRVTAASRPIAVTIAGGKLVVPFGADPLMHQSYGGLAGFDQRLLPPIWAAEGLAAHLLYQRGELVLTDDAFIVRGYGLSRADDVLNLQGDVSAADHVRPGWGNRLGAAWKGIAAWYSAYFNPLGFERHLFMQAVDVTVYRQRSVPVLGHFSFGAGLLRADVAGGGAGVGGVGKDDYHFGSYFQVRYHPTDWLFAQYRQGLRTFDNRRGVILDNSRLTSADGSTHSFGVVGRYRGLSAGVFYFINLEKVDEIPDDLFRVTGTYEF